MKNILNFFVIILLFFTTSVAHATSNVQINEIAWMGTSVSSTKEWIELYNPTSDSVDLTGWKLNAGDGSPAIILSGTVITNGYFILERTSDDTIPGITANQIYTGALSNSGEDLQLIDAKGNVIDNVDGSAGWPAGDDTNKNTMQRSGSNWITAAPTPNAQNAAAADPGTNTNSGSGSGTTTTSSSDNDSGTNSTTLAKSTSEIETPVKPDPLFSAHMVVPDTGVAGVGVPMSVAVTDNGHKDMVTGRFQWSTGDGGYYNFSSNIPIQHIFKYPGTYTVVMTYYSNTMKSDPDSIHKKSITIVDSSLALSGITSDGGVQISNSTNQDIDLKGWTISSHGTSYVFPPYTIVSAGQTLSISSEILGFPTASADVILGNPAGTIISTLSAHKYSRTYQNSASILDSDGQDSLETVATNTVKGTELVAETVPQVLSTTPKQLDQKSISDRSWITWIIIGAVALGIAYGAVRLYATRNQETDDFDGDEFEGNDELL